MARKTAIRITNDELNAETYRADERRDAASTARAVPAGLLSLSDWRAMRGQLQPAELLALCKSAARLELRGAMYGADDKLDVAARIMTAVLWETGGAMPRRESDRVKLGRLCGDAKNYRRSLDAQRDRDTADAQATADRAALAPDALAPDGGMIGAAASAVAVLGQCSPKHAALAADAIARKLRLQIDRDAPAWTIFYQWARGETSETCAAELDISHGAYRVRASRGAKFVRGFYGATELLRRLSFGAMLAADGTLTYSTGDDSREAHTRTRMLADVGTAPHWRDRDICPDAPITVRKVRKRTPKLAAVSLETRAASLRSLGSALAQTSPRGRTRPSQPTSDLRRALDTRARG